MSELTSNINIVPLVIYNKDGSRTVIGSAIIELEDDVANISGIVAKEYKHLVEGNPGVWDFSFTPYPARELKSPEDKDEPT